MTGFKETNVIKTFNVGLIVSMMFIFMLGVITLFSATKGPGSPRALQGAAHLVRGRAPAESWDYLYR